MGLSNVTRMIVGPIETNCFFLENKESHEVAIIDPGESGEEIYGRIKRQGMHLTAVLLTHGHFDHITGIAALLSAAAQDGKADVPV